MEPLKVLVQSFFPILADLESATDRVMKLEEVAIEDNTFAILNTARSLKPLLEKSETNGLPSRIAYVRGEMQKAVGLLKARERDYLLSPATTELMKRRIDKLDCAIRFRHRKALDRKLRVYEITRKHGILALYELRQAYLDLLKEIDRAEYESSKVDREEGLVVKRLQVA